MSLRWMRMVLLDDAKTSMGDHVGLFGAIEIRFRSGPVLLDSRYRVTGEVVADMRMMLRQLKQSSPLYQAPE